MVEQEVQSVIHYWFTDLSLLRQALGAAGEDLRSSLEWLGDRLFYERVSTRLHGEFADDEFLLLREAVQIHTKNDSLNLRAEDLGLKKGWVADNRAKWGASLLESLAAAIWLDGGDTALDDFVGHLFGMKESPTAHRPLTADRLYALGSYIVPASIGRLLYLADERPKGAGKLTQAASELASAAFLYEGTASLWLGEGRELADEFVQLFFPVLRGGKTMTPKRKAYVPIPLNGSENAIAKNGGWKWRGRENAPWRRHR